MSENYSIRINIREGLVEITGEDKTWVSERLAELKEIYSSPSPIKAPKVTETSSAGKQSLGKAQPGQKKKTSPTSGRAQKNPELAAKLTKEVQQSLEKYMQARKINFDKSLPAQAAVIAIFLNDELGWAGVDQHDLYTVYSTMGWRQPGNIKSQLNNALSRNNYFGGVTDGKYIPSLKGENYARHDSLAQET
jgi:hypothetical protein